MVEVQNTIQETGSIVLVEMYSMVLITMIIVGIHDAYKKWRENNKKNNKKNKKK